MCPKDADGMANSIDFDQTAPLGTVWSGSALFVSLICPSTYNFYSRWLFYVLHILIMLFSGVEGSNKEMMFHKVYEEAVQKVPSGKSIP